MFILKVAFAAVCARGILADQPACSIPSLYSASLEELTLGLENGCFTSVDLVQAYEARINEVNDELHAVVELNPDALSIAAELDAERANGSTRSLLHGIPILVKDNIATFDKMNNTAGSYALLGAKVPRDSSVVHKLKTGGAIILGKTNLSQWAMFRSGNTTSGWSSIGGQTYGPYYPNQDPCGSSSGSGIAAGIGLSFAALGTETRGSILEPASRSNAVGIKPSVGLTSRYLVVPITEFQDTIGPLARTVYDAAAVLSLIAGIDELDEATSLIPNGGKVPDYLAATTRYPDLSGVRIGVPRNGFSSELLYQSVNETVIMTAFDEAIAVLQSLGAEVIDATNFSSIAVSTMLHGFADPAITNEVISCSAGFNSGLETYLGELIYNPYNISSVSDLINFTKTDPREEYPDRNVVAWEGAVSLGYGVSDERAVAAHQGSVDADAEGGVSGVLALHNLSALIIPTDYAPTWASTPGLPGISVPLGVYPPDTPVITGLRELIDVAPGIPFGLTFLGKKWSEETLIGIAHAYEKAADPRGRLIPGSKATIPTIEIVDIQSQTSPNSTSTGNAPASTPTSTNQPSSAVATRYNGLAAACVWILVTVLFF